MFALGSGIVAIGFGLSILFFVPKEKIDLYIEDNHITWKDESGKNTLGSKYYIYNDDFLVNKVTEQSYFLTKEKLIDEEGPEKVNKVNINYTEKTIYFTWEDVKDLGTNNNIWVSLYNENEKQISYSNSVNMNYSSGVYKYILELNGEEYEIYDTEFTVERERLNSGITMAKLYAIDNRGNKGVVSNIPLYNYNIILSKEDNLLRYHIDDSTQEYKYKAYINGEEKGFISSAEDLNSLIIDKSAPSLVTNTNFDIKDKKVNITWKDVVDTGTDYLVRLESYGLTYYNTAYSDDIKINKTSETKGYFYAINKTDDYIVTDEDDFTNRTDIDFEGDYGRYYIHLAAVDNEGNLSKTSTFNFELKDLSINNIISEGDNVVNDNLNGAVSDSGQVNDNVSDSGNSSVDIDSEKTSIDIINNILIAKGSVSVSSYNKSIDILKGVSLDLLKRFDSMGIKVYITSGEAEDLYVSLMGESIDESISGIFVWNISKPFIIVETSYLDSTLLHEVGHAIDYILGKGNFVSEDKEFLSVYEEEKDIFFSSNDYVKNSSKEYFAESYVLFCNSPYNLKTEAPKTYEYFKNMK